MRDSALDLLKAQGLAQPLQILAWLTLLAVLPAIVLGTTSFVRTIVVLSFLRQGLGAQQTPPSQVIIGLSLFMTFFTMSPVLSDMKHEAYDPYMAGKITDVQAFERALPPLKQFMLKHTREADLRMFYEATSSPLPQTPDDVGMLMAMPAFMISELTTAFQMGVIVLLPFLVVDFVVASLLMSMGMMMVPPSTLSLPIKLLLFVLVDGWSLLTSSLLRSFS